MFNELLYVCSIYKIFKEGINITCLIDHFMKADTRIVLRKSPQNNWHLHVVAWWLHLQGYDKLIFSYFFQVYLGRL